ncbi:MAG: FecR domain-containing protein [Ignavibacteriae bacterium]|nr:FecR domain-containing protein [Ignavibacteriota bacterium]
MTIAMAKVLQKLKSIFRFDNNDEVVEASINEILHGLFVRLRKVNPDTCEQWLRLQRALAQSELEPRQFQPRLKPRFALGVAIIVLAILGGYVYFISTQTSLERFATGRGERKAVILHDGSQVTLNHTTELVVSELRRGMSRRLSLQGEAYFRVRHNGDPFIISTAFADVQVVGTEFNVRAREEVLEVAVIEGAVNLSASRRGRDSSILLSKHQMALCLQNDFPKRIADVPSSEYPGWMHGKLLFNRTSFVEACREIELRFDVTISIKNQKVRGEAATGILDAKTAESALSALCELTGKTYERDGQGYTVY